MSRGAALLGVGALLVLHVEGWSVSPALGGRPCAARHASVLDGDSPAVAENDGAGDADPWWSEFSAATGAKDEKESIPMGEGPDGGAGEQLVAVFEDGGSALGSAGESTRMTKRADKGNEKRIPKRHKRAKRPIVAILGRPNVGKSAIANRISGRFQRGAIVHDEVGVTRDRTYLPAEWGGFHFDVVDTGGLVFDDDESSLFLEQIRQQAAIALSEACVAVLVVDGQAGATALDEQVARFLRKDWCHQLPVFVAVNKCESRTVGELQAADFWSLGLGTPHPVSGIHGNGVADLLDEIKEHLYPVDDDAVETDTVNVAIVGRPNVGKSSLFNRLFGEARAIVSDVAGTTRDTLDAELQRDNRVYRFIDTAGIRKKGKVQYGSEFFMVNRALKAIRRADVVLLVLDATTGISDQDRTLAQRIVDDGRACVVLLNKWDAVEDKDDKTYLRSIEYVRDMLQPVRWAPVVLVSALTGQRCPKIYNAIDEAVQNHRTKRTTSVLNDVLRDAVQWQPPPFMKNGQGKVYYCNQVDVSPPTIVMFCNKPALFHENYRRYLDRKFRESLGFEGTPIKFVWRGKRVRALEQDRRS